MKTNNMVVVAVTPPRIWAYFILKVVSQLVNQLASLMSNHNSHKLLKKHKKQKTTVT